MTGEIATYVQELDFLLWEAAGILEALTPSEMNWRPLTGQANSAYAIASHIVGTTRLYILGFVCRLLVERDRDLEFAAVGSDACDLIAALHQLRNEITIRLETLTPHDLDARATASKLIDRVASEQGLSAREAIVESIRHIALHVGELRLTRDLARHFSTD